MEKDPEDILLGQYKMLKDIVYDIDELMKNNKEHLSDQQVKLLQGYKTALQKAIGKLTYYVTNVHYLTIEINKRS